MDSSLAQKATSWRGRRGYFDQFGDICLNSTELITLPSLIAGVSHG
jgi:hypothetical protein